MTLGSLFSGCGGFDLGFDQAGFDLRWQVEIEPDCVAVLARHWPTVRRYRDVNAMVYGRHRNRQAHGLTLERVDCIIGGFPCQDVSVAGKRKGLAGSRSGLFFAFMRALRLLKPRWAVIENVPGLLSSHGGRDFHTVLSAMAECGFRRAYRILDSQHFGVPQRRRRVFIVGRARAIGGSAEAVLFESLSGAGDSQTGAAQRPRVAASLRGRSSRAGVNEPGRGGEDDSNLVIGFGSNPTVSEDVPCLNGRPMQPAVFQESQYGIRGYEEAGSLRAGRIPEHQLILAIDNRQAAAAAVPSTLRANPHGANPMVAYALRRDPGGTGQGHNTNYVVSSSGERERALVGSMHKRHDEDTDTLVVNALCPVGGGADDNDAQAGHLVAPTLDQSLGHHRGALGVGDFCQPATAGVRRLTPLECERLQGFPDGWTCLCGNGHKGSQYCTCPDTPRYKMLGNAVTVPVARWIAERLRVGAVVGPEG